MFTRFALNHHMAVLVLCVGLVLMGVSSYIGMPRENFPEVKIPYVIVTTTLQGANPQDVETSITIPLETELDGIDGLKEMRSESSEGVSTIILEFDPEVETEVSLSRTRDKVDIAKGDLPTDADEPVVQEFTFANEPVLIYTVAGSDQVALTELYDVAEDLQDELEAIPGVLGVDLYGDREREILIQIDMDRLHFYQISLATAISILRGTNENVSAGTADGPTNRIIVRAPGEFKSPDEIFNLVIGTTAEGVPVYMRDVAMVMYSFEDETSRARIYDFTQGSGDNTKGEWVTPRKGISLHLKKRTGENLLSIVEQAKKIVADMPLSSEIEIIKTLDMSKHVDMMIGDLENNIGTALILVLAVMFFGMGGRNAVLVALAIPFSMLLSFFVLSLMGQTLNTMVLFSLVLALGMLVDNAIVIIENIYRHYGMGKTRYEAALLGTSEVAAPVIASTVTTLGAFFPLLFWPGIMGEFMSYLPLTVIVVLSSSLFVALVINPTLTAMFIKRKQGADPDYDPETQRPNYRAVVSYSRMLEFMLQRPGWTLTNAVLLLFLTLGLYAAFGHGVEFFPTIDPSTCTMSVSPPEGTSVEETNRLCRLMEDRVFGKPGSGYDRPVQNLKQAGVTVDVLGGTSYEGIAATKVSVEFVDREYRTEPTGETLKEMRNRVEGLDKDGNRVTTPLYGADFDVFLPQEGPPTGKPISIDIFGEDLQEMARIVEDMKRIMTSISGVAKPTDDAAVAQPTMEWTIDKGRAGLFGLDHQSIGQILKMAVGGLDSGTFGHGDDEQDIVLRMTEPYRLRSNMLQNVSIPLPSGGSVPLSAVATATLEPGPVTIKHLDRKRVITAGAEVQPGIRQDADLRRMFQEEARRYPFPPGVTYQFGGAADEQQKAQDFLSGAFIQAILIIVFVLVIQFNSLAMPAIITSSVLLSLMGVFSGLVIFQIPFGIIMSGIGVISLAGVVVNNAIVLLDAIRRFEQEGQATYDAIVTACMIRFRPVLLTAITTILALVPMAAKFNLDFINLSIQYNTDSSQWWQSMALAVIFGLLLATALTLGVVPTLYLVFQRARCKVAVWMGRVPDQSNPCYEEPKSA